jgi:hypothetical protein
MSESWQRFELHTARQAETTCIAATRRVRLGRPSRASTTRTSPLSSSRRIERFGLPADRLDANDVSVAAHDLQVAAGSQSKGFRGPWCIARCRVSWVPVHSSPACRPSDKKRSAGVRSKHLVTPGGELQRRVSRSVPRHCGCGERVPDARVGRIKPERPSVSKGMLGSSKALRLVLDGGSLSPAS